MKAVDLGLSIYWGDTPLEVSNKHYKEHLFTWGDDSYNYANRKRFADYIDYDELLKEGIIEDSGYLSPQYDHAYKILGDKWRMPTVEEFEELITKCKWIWDRDGYLVTGPSKNSVKIPFEASYRKSVVGIEDIWYLGEVEKVEIFQEVKCFWSSEPSYDMTADGMTNEAFALRLSNPGSNMGSRISSEHRSNKNLIIPVTSDRTLVKEDDESPVKPQVKKPWLMDMGDIELGDSISSEPVLPPLIPNGTDFPLPLWNKLSDKLKTYLNEHWDVKCENDYNKLLNNIDEVLILEHHLKCKGLI